jgi:hypothetical protein
MNAEYKITEIVLHYDINFERAMNSGCEVLVLGGAGIYIC